MKKSIKLTTKHLSMVSWSLSIYKVPTIMLLCLYYV
jgi:hypothetical protein